MVVGEFTQDADVVVIGGGPAGYACAFALGDAGRDVTVIDPRPSLGGACLHDACIPTKTALHAASTASASGHAALGGEPGTVDSAALDAWTARTVGRLGAGLGAGAAQRNIQIVQGTARFLSSREVQVAGQEVTRYRFKRAVIATGSVPVRHASGVDDPRWSTPDAMLQDSARCAGRVVVIGNDAIAVESAAICTGLGGDVTVLTDGSRILPDIPEALAAPVVKAMRPDDRPIESASASDAGITVHLGGADIEGDLIIDASSRRGATDDLGLESTGCLVKDDFVGADNGMATDDPRILACGDCIGPPLWAGAALHRGRIAAEAICSGTATWDCAAVPRLVFSDPQICWCGSDDGAESTVIPWAYSGLAVAMNAASGCTMLCWDTSSGVITGCGACGSGATELAGACTIAVEMGATLQDLADMVVAHPTRGELLFDAAREALRQS